MKRRTRFAAAAAGVSLALLLGGCGGKPEAPEATGDPNAAVQARLNDPNVSEAEKETIRRQMSGEASGTDGAAGTGATGGTDGAAGTGATGGTAASGGTGAPASDTGAATPPAGESQSGS